MKQVMLFSAVLFIGLCCSSDLCAQSCQPNPACKVICSSSKASLQNDAANPNPVAGTLKAVTVSQPAAAAGPATQKAGCNPANCDLSKCDPTNCDLSKCNPADCDVSKCIPANGTGGAKSKSTRI